MGSSLGEIIANAFFACFEENWLQNYPSDFKPHYYRRYANNIFVLFPSQEQLEAFRNFLNGRHAIMSFTIENGKQNRMSFLDVQIIGEDKTFTASIYSTPTFSGVYTQFDSFLPPDYKFGIVDPLADRCFQIWSSQTKLYTELVCLEKVFSVDSAMSPIRVNVLVT